MSESRPKSLRIRFLRRRLLDSDSKPIAQRAILLATELFSRAAGLARRRARDTKAHTVQLRAALHAAEVRAHIAERNAELL